MSAKVIISYDGTNNEDDAIALGRLLARAGAELALAYVVHTPQPGDRHEPLGDREATALLERGAALLGSEVPLHVVADRSTPAGLSALAEREGAQAIVFCSDSHTSPGHIAIGNSAQRLLDGGRTAVAIASAGLAQRGDLAVSKIAATDDPGDPSARRTAEALASAFGAEVVPVRGPVAELLVVGSRPEAAAGQLAVSSAALNLIESSIAGVVVVPREVAVAFGQTPVSV